MPIVPYDPYRDDDADEELTDIDDLVDEILHDDEMPVSTPN